MTSGQIDSLLERIGAQCPGEGRRWLGDVVASLASRPDDAATAVLRAFPAVARRVGTAPLAPGAPLEAGGVAVPVATDEAARIALLLGAAAHVSDAAFEGLVRTAYDEGDTRERTAVLRGLAFLPQPERFVPIALDAGRTNDVGLFQALACDNPFPALHYGEAEINKLVMKAVFVEAPLERIVGLTGRANPEMARMAMERIDEQQSAGRSFPPALWLAIAPCAPPGAVARMIGELEHSRPERRAGAARGLRLARAPRAVPFLTERRGREGDATVRQAIDDALDALTTREDRP
jgi:hypothetical protein